MRVPIAAVLWAAATFALSLSAATLEKVSFGTDWKAEAEHGG